MIRFVYWVLSFCLAVGVVDAVVSITLRIAGAAVHAHKHDQLSYSDFTKALTGAKPRQSAKPSPASNHQ